MGISETPLFDSNPHPKGSPEWWECWVGIARELDKELQEIRREIGGFRQTKRTLSPQRH